MCGWMNLILVEILLWFGDEEFFSFWKIEMKVYDECS